MIILHKLWHRSAHLLFESTAMEMELAPREERKGRRLLYSMKRGVIVAHAGVQQPFFLSLRNFCANCKQCGVADWWHFYMQLQGGGIIYFWNIVWGVGRLLAWSTITNANSGNENILFSAPCSINNSLPHRLRLRLYTQRNHRLFSPHSVVVAARCRRPLAFPPLLMQLSGASVEELNNFSVF